MITCRICGKPVANPSWAGNTCRGRCGTISIITGTSIEYARSGIANCDDASIIRDAISVEEMHHNRSSMLKMLNSRLRKIEKGN